MLKLIFAGVLLLAASSLIYSVTVRFINLPFLSKLEIGKYGLKCFIVGVITLGLWTTLVTFF